jgi:hypothetical protein
MKVLVACEFSGIVREAFRKRGHDAWSCDLLDTDIPSQFHFKGNIFDYIYSCNGNMMWDMLIAFPPCTHLAVSGARWFKDKRIEQRKGKAFFMSLSNLSIAKICIENPIGIMSTYFRKPDQIIQPWQFGHGETKATCLWLKNLPLLKSTNIVEGREARIHKMPPHPDRWKERSRTYQGIANAMAEQWG